VSSLRGAPRRQPCGNAGGSRKIRYLPERTARRAARITRGSGPDPDRIHVYLCPSGGRARHFHVGHTFLEEGAE
jgi:hypothetical protein